MKSLSLIFFLVAAPQIAGAQKIRFTDTTNVWTLLYYSFGDPGHEITTLSRFGVSGDTLVAGKSYRKILGQGMFREDTSAGKIYFRSVGNVHPLYQTDTLEHLYFDYGLKMGDTLRIDYLDTAIRIDAVDSVSLGGVYHKVWHFNNTRFIEGIGTTAGPDFLIYPKVFELAVQLRCFFTKGLQPLCSPSQPLPYGGYHVYSGYQMVQEFDNDQSCAVTSVDVPKFRPTFGVSLSSNPGGANTILRFDYFVGPVLIRIADCTGNELKKVKVTGREFNIGQYLHTPGIYYYLVEDEASGQHCGGQFVFQ